MKTTSIESYAYYPYLLNCKLLSMRQFEKREVLNKVTQALQKHGYAIPKGMQACSLRLQSKEVWQDNEEVAIEVEEEGNTHDNLVIEIVCGVTSLEAIRGFTIGRLHMIGGEADIEDMANENTLKFALPSLEFKTKSRQVDGDLVRTGPGGRVLRFPENLDRQPPVFYGHNISLRRTDRASVTRSGV